MEGTTRVNDLDEEIIEPTMPIIDPHHHLWSLSDSFFEQHGGDVAVGSRRYLLEEFLADVSTGHDVRATVYIEADPMRPMYRPCGPESMRSVGEVEFATGVAAMAASGSFGRIRVAAAVVAHTRLEQDEATLAAVLDSFRAIAGSRFRGIRQPTISSRVPGLLRDECFRRGFQLLAQRGLTFDALVESSELDDVADLAEAFPGTTIVLNHLGWSGELEFTVWRNSVRRLAEYNNVVVKLGGLGMTLAGKKAVLGSPEIAARWRPYIETCIEAFGANRSMFEGNFPMDSRACSYPQLWNAFKRIAEGTSFSERSALFWGTASRVYGVDIESSDGEDPVAWTPSRR